MKAAIDTAHNDSKFEAVMQGRRPWPTPKQIAMAQTDPSRQVTSTSLFFGVAVFIPALSSPSKILLQLPSASPTPSQHVSPPAFQLQTSGRGCPPGLATCHASNRLEEGAKPFRAPAQAQRRGAGVQPGQASETHSHRAGNARIGSQVEERRGRGGATIRSSGCGAV